MKYMTSSFELVYLGVVRVVLFVQHIILYQVNGEAEMRHFGDAFWGRMSPLGNLHFQKLPNEKCFWPQSQNPRCNSACHIM